MNNPDYLLAQITVLTNPSTRFTSHSTLLPNIVSVILRFAIAAAGFFFLYRTLSSGYAYMNSLGDPGKLQTINREIVNALFGLIIVITSFFIAQVIEVILGIDFI